MGHSRRSLSLSESDHEDEGSPWPAFGDIALALLLVFMLFILAQFLHYDRLFVLERLTARQDSLEMAVRAGLTPEQEQNIDIESLDEYHQRLTFQAELLFRSCESEVTPQGESMVRSVGAAVSRYAPYFHSVQVEGHTDSRRPGPLCGFEDNWALSSARATAVVRLLGDSTSSSSIQPRLLSAVGRGPFHPAGDALPGDTTPDTLARHRRIELLLQYSDSGVVRFGGGDSE